MNDILSPEELDAMELLSKNHKLLVILVPKGVPDDFSARLTTWSNYILDTRLIPPLPVPVAQKGDGLVCPYCEAPATTQIDAHVPGCIWVTAVTRWGAAQMEIEEEFGSGRES